MKKIAIYILVCATITSAFANNRPEEVRSQLSEVHARAWYEEQSRLWESYLNVHPEDVSGWLTYFKTTAYAGKDERRTAQIVEQLETRFEGSFEATYAKAKRLGWNSEGIAVMTKAIDLNKDVSWLLPDQIMLTEISGNRALRKKISESLFQSQLIYPSLLNYAYNVLMSVKEDGILVVQGEATTIPLWLLQDVMDVRNDVSILNTDLAKNGSYLANWILSKGMKAPENLLGLSSETVMESLPELNPKSDFYFALTLPQDQLNSIQDRLYVVGLTSLHKDDSFDHYGTLKKNVETKFLLDYLTVDFSGEPKTSTGRTYETNYLLPFLLLKEHYEKAGDEQAALKWKNMILTLADRSQIKNRVAMIMEEREAKSYPSSFKITTIEHKELEKKIVKVKGNLYASTTELTNKDYWFYIDYLDKNGYQDLFDEAIADVSKYDELTFQLLSNYVYSATNYQILSNKIYKSKNAGGYPAIDMSFEAAKAYCEWLTFQYNRQEDRKYQKVKFRLPTKKEWTMAALGYQEFTSWDLEKNVVEAGSDIKKAKKDMKEYKLSEYKVLYPWWSRDFSYRDKIRNNKDCYLANVKTPDEIFCPAGIKGDGFTLMSPVGTYFSNQMGFFDVVGNVAEMIDQPGKAMGGSWNHEPEECTIQSVNSYEKSDSSVGFRVFMEVIEE